MSAVDVIQPPRITGAPGYSAYQLAVQGGYTGTQAQWLASLVGPPADTTALNTAVTNAGTSATSASNNATAAYNSAGAAATSAQAAASSANIAGNNATTAANRAADAGTSATAALNSAGASAGSATNSANSATLAQAWAMQMSGTVDGTSYSAKWYAQLAANWASQATGTVDGTNLSAKQYALQAAQSAAQAAGAGIAPQGSFAVGDFIVAASTTGGSAKSLGAPAAVATSGSASDITKGTLPAAQLPAHGVANSNLAQMPAGTVKANLTGALADAADVTPSAVLDTFSSTQGTILIRGASGWAALGVGTAGQALVSGGPSANPLWSSAITAFPVSKVVPKTAAYSIAASDNATLFDLTGSFALTLPAASGASPSAPLWFHFRKRDGSGQCTVVPNGTDKIEGANAPIAIYQERATLVSYGSGWIFPPGGRERVVYVVPPGTTFTGVSSIALTTGFDADVAEEEINLDNLTTSTAAGQILAQLYQGGAYVTTGYSYAGPDGAGANYATDFSANGTAIPLSAIGTLGSGFYMSATVTVRNVQSATAGGASVEARGSIIGTAASGSYVFNLRARSASANAIGGLKLYPSTGTATGTYSQRITRA